MSKTAYQSSKQKTVLLSLISCLVDTQEASSTGILLLELHLISLDGRKHAVPTSQQTDEAEVQYRVSRT